MSFYIDMDSNLPLPPAPLLGSSWASWGSASPSCSAPPSAGCAVAWERRNWRGRRGGAASRRCVHIPYTSSPSLETYRRWTAKTQGCSDTARSSTRLHDTAPPPTVGPHLPMMRWLKTTNQSQHPTFIHLRVYLNVNFVFLCVFQLGCKPDDLPPAYTEHNVPVYPITPPPHTDTTQSQTWSQP